MAEPTFDYDVYNTPRIGPIEFGEFVASEASGRESVARSAKYARRGPRTRAWFARQHIGSFLTSPVRKIGDLDAALAQARSDAKNESLPDQKQADAGASAECLDTFIKNLNILNIAGKDIVGLPDEQFPVTLGLLRIQIDFACLLKSTSKKDKIEKVGAIFLNTQKGKGLGQKDDAKAKRNKAGETVALLVFKRLMDEFSDIGEPMQEDAIHLYVRAGHLWSAPIAYANRLKNLEAESRILASLWDSVNPPPDFNPDKAKYHD